VLYTYSHNSDHLCVTDGRVYGRTDGGHSFNLLFVLFCFGFYVTSTQYRSYRDVPALQVESPLCGRGFKIKIKNIYHQLLYRVNKKMSLFLKNLIICN
jgi:hypothetical protein